MPRIFCRTCATRAAWPSRNYSSRAPQKRETASVPGTSQIKWIGTKARMDFEVKIPLSPKNNPSIVPVACLAQPSRRTASSGAGCYEKQSEERGTAGRTRSRLGCKYIHTVREGCCASSCQKMATKTREGERERELDDKTRHFEAFHLLADYI